MIREIEDAEVEAKELLEVCPDWWLSSYQAARISASKGQYEEAIDEPWKAERRGEERAIAVL